MTKPTETLNRLAVIRDDDGNDQNLFVCRAEARKLGDHVARGITDHLWQLFACWFTAWFILTAGLGWLDRHGYLRPIDATDGGFAARSGVKLRTDHGTGCQYLESSDGALTPRMTASGKQSGCRA